MRAGGGDEQTGIFGSSGTILRRVLRHDIRLAGLAEGGGYGDRLPLGLPEFEALKTRYPIERAAGRGGAFARALRLCRYLAPRLKHESMYDNHVPCNALALLDYCFERKDVGINCLNKAKILAECCLAVGIPARRVWMYPASPYDMDNHVVTEIYDRRRGGWLALDPTTGAYFIGEEGKPLSLLAVRRRMAMRERVTAVLPRQSAKDISELAARNMANGTNPYYAKNMAFSLWSSKARSARSGRRRISCRAEWT